MKGILKNCSCSQLFLLALAAFSLTAFSAHADIVNKYVEVPVGFFIDDTFGLQTYRDFLDYDGDGRPELVLRDDGRQLFHVIDPDQGYENVWSYSPDPGAICTDCTLLLFRFEGFYRLSAGSSQTHLAIGFEFYDSIQAQRFGILLVNVDTGVVDQRFDDYTFKGSIERPVGLGIFADLILKNKLSDIYEIWSSNAPTAVPQSAQELFRLRQNYPNPFNPATVLSFFMEKEASASVEIHDIQGRLVFARHLGVLTEGLHEITWVGADRNGQKVASGTYFYSIIADGKRQSGKMAVVR